MPTVLRVGAFRLHFHGHEPNEPPHIHVDRDALSAQLSLAPVALAPSMGFRAAELQKVDRLVVKHQTLITKAWNGTFDS